MRSEQPSRNRITLIIAGFAVTCLAVGVLNFERIRQILPNPFILETCIWGANLYSWVDKNENGVWDEGEAPLPDITYGVIFEDGDVLEITSDENGEAHVVFHKICGSPAETVNIYAEVPEGMQSTTQAFIPELSTAKIIEDPLLFGFVQDKAQD